MPSPRAVCYLCLEHPRSRHRREPEMCDVRMRAEGRIVATGGPGVEGCPMAQREPPGPFCFDCVHYPEAPADLEESAPDRAAGRSLTAEFSCPRIRRQVKPTYAAHCDEYQEAEPED